MADRYTKIVLTVIALALIALLAKPFVRPECGGLRNPCVVQPPPLGFYVKAGPGEFYVTNAPEDPLLITTLVGLPIGVQIHP